MSLTSATWEEIGRPRQGGNGWLVRRLHPDSQHEIQVARRARDDAIGLLFEVSTRSMPMGATLPDCVGFNTILETIAPGPGGICRICLVLKDQIYLEIFATLASDIVARVLLIEDEPTAVRALLSRLSTWQRFLEKFGINLLTAEEQAGLFAELLMLEREMVPILGATAAVRSWRGPFGEPHDFRSGEIAVEVKATTSRDPTAFQVANLQQLDQGAAERLFLVHVSLLSDTVNGLSLPDLVTRVRVTLASVDPGAASEFVALLQEAGFLDIHTDAYQGRRLGMHACRWFEVIDGFPRLTAVSVPEGVLTARYSVSLTRCAPFEVDSQVPRSHLMTRNS